MTSETKQRWYTVLFLLCMFIISISIPFSWFISNDIVVDILNCILKVGFIIFAIYYCKKYKVGYLNVFNYERKHLMFLPFILICFVNYIYVWLAKVPSGSYATNAEVIVKIIFYLLVAISEEMMFRGVILEEFLKTHNKLLSIIYSSLIFGGVHLLGISSLATLVSCSIQCVYAIGIGLVCGLIYVYSKNVSFTILFHFLFNLFNDALVVYFTTFSLDSMDIEYYIFIIIFSVIMINYGLITYLFFNEKEEVK